MKKILISTAALALSATVAMATPPHGGSGNDVNYSGSVGAGSFAAGGSIAGNVGNGKSMQGSGSGAYQNSGLSFNEGPNYLSIGTITEGGDYAWTAGKTKNAFGASGALSVRGGWSVGTGTIDSGNEWRGHQGW